MEPLTCQQCGSVMVEKTKSSRIALGLALIGFVTGVGLTFTFVGAIVGIPLMLLALIIGIPLLLRALVVDDKKSKVWKCKSCGDVIARD